MPPERKRSMQSERLKEEYTISGGEKEKKDMWCEQEKRKTDDKLKMQSMSLGKQLRREFRGVYYCRRARNLSLSEDFEAKYASRS